MKRLVPSLLAATALLLGPASQAQVAPAARPAATTATTQTAPAPATATQATPAMWMVKDDDTTIYMLGTVHVLKPGLSWFDGAVRKAFDASQEVVLEIVMPEDDQAAAAAMIPAAIDRSGTPLTQRLPEAARPRYTATMQSLGLAATQFEQFRPWFVSTMLTMMPLMKLGYDPKTGVEKQVTAAAKAAGKPVGALETIDQQLGFFNAIPDQAQIAMLVSTVDKIGEVGPTLDRMVDAWAKGDPDRLAAQMNEQMKETPEVAKVLLYDRNARWADWIKARLDKPGTVFMAVGAGHLAGSNSVQDALKARGIASARVPNPR